MDPNLENIKRLHMEECMKNLEKNNMKAYFAKTKKDCKKILKSLINENETVAVGGSMTLFECDIINFLREGNFNFLDRYKPGLNKDEVEKIYRESFFADTYISSVNAITKDGTLYNVDGNSNRIAAISYGPKSVILIAGVNKIVDSIDDAIKRVKCIAAPSNATRLSSNTPCKSEGKCISLKKKDSQIQDGCNTDARICCNYLISSYQRHKNRIKVILCQEDLGY